MNLVCEFVFMFIFMLMLFCVVCVCVGGGGDLPGLYFRKMHYHKKCTAFAMWLTMIGEEKVVDLCESDK